MLAVSLLTDVVDFEHLAGEWDALLARSDADEPTLSSLWLLAWWRVFGRTGGRRLSVLLFSRGDRLVGAAPLLRRRHWYRHALPFRRLELLASGEDEADEICSEYLGLIAERGLEAQVAAAFARALVEGTLSGWDELLLPAMDAGRPITQHLQAELARAQLHPVATPGASAPYIPLPPSWEAYLKALPSQRRYVVTRSLRDFERWSGGAHAVHVARTYPELADGRRILEALHGENWSGKGASGVFHSPRFAAFHDAVMRPLLDRGALELLWVTVGDRPVAVLYNIVWKGKVYFYQSGRTLEHPKGVRPGIVAHAFAIQRAIAAGLREYDFLAGTQQYKQQLALERRPIVTLRAVHTRWRERARLLGERGVQALRRRFRRAPGPDAPTPDPAATP